MNYQCLCTITLLSLLVLSTSACQKEIIAPINQSEVENKVTVNFFTKQILEEEAMPIKWVDCSMGVRFEKSNFSNSKINISTEKEPIQEVVRMKDEVLLVGGTSKE